MMPLQKPAKRHTKHDSTSIHPTSTTKDKKRSLFRFRRKKSQLDSFNDSTKNKDHTNLGTDRPEAIEGRKKSGSSSFSKSESINNEKVYIQKVLDVSCNTYSLKKPVNKAEVLKVKKAFSTIEDTPKSEQRPERNPIPQQIIDLHGKYCPNSGALVVQPADEDDNIDCFPVTEREAWKVPDKNYHIRIFRDDGTFATQSIPINTTAGEVVQRLADKLFLQDLAKYRLTLVKNSIERVIHIHEQPIKIQKKLLEQIGYTYEDNIGYLGREDHSYLYRFQFGENNTNELQNKTVKPDGDIDLAAKNITTVPSFLYNYAADIYSLDLSQNVMVDIPIKFLQRCENLRDLSLKNNEYTRLPFSIRSVPRLKYLNISGNKIEDLAESNLHELTSLVSLYAFNNRLSSLSDDFAKFKNLTALHISNNSITMFPLVICDIISLTRLNISFNKISMFPEEIGALSRLMVLSAIANRLSGSLPKAFSKLKSLKKLDLRQNQITNLESLYGLIDIEHISIDYNSIDSMNYGFKYLKKLIMPRNHLRQFNIVGIQCALTEINLASCEISSLPDDLFYCTVSLASLTLDRNLLTSLPNSITCLIRLSYLSVKNNVLDTLPSGISRMKNLKTLNVQSNRLTAIPQDIWLCAVLKSFNCSSNLLESFPEPYNILSSEDFSLAEPASYIEYDSKVPVNESIHPFDVSSGPQPINFNPPSFFGNPQNHPPPLSLVLTHLYLGDNRLTDDIWSPISLFNELQTLNLSFNDLYEIPPDGLCHIRLFELYLSGNHLVSLPSDDIARLSHLRVLALNSNKLQTLPGEICKLRKLSVLDAGHNVLKYNVSNWPYDWNWNHNLGLKYLNLSGNKRLEIKSAFSENQSMKEETRTDFSALTRLRMLGLMDITISKDFISPDENTDRRVRSSPSEVNGMSYGVADWLGASNHILTWDLVKPRFRKESNECLFGLFDCSKNIRSGCRLAHFLNENICERFQEELEKNGRGDTIVSALRRTFLKLERAYEPMEDKENGVSGLVCYFTGKDLYVANAGDALAVMSRNNGQAYEITQKHIPLHPSEIVRIRNAGGFVSNSGELNEQITVSRGFGYYNLIPVVNPNPFISKIELEESDEFVIMASKGFWDKFSYQAAVDIVRTEKGDLMVAAQKLRDLALAYGSNEKMTIMIVGVGGLFSKHEKHKKMWSTSRLATNESVSLADEGISTPGIINKNKRRIKGELTGDSTLARLDKEVSPPTNQVALVFTDIKSSTLLWDTQLENMRSAIKIHDAVMRRTLRSIGGYEVKTEGDAFMVCFQDVVAALLWCFTVQLQLLEADWPAGILEAVEGGPNIIYRGLSVRMGIHLGTPVYERNPITKRMDYFGPVVNKASRICNVADGGQICVSSDVITALRKSLGILEDDDENSLVTKSHSRDIQQLKQLGFRIVDLGEHRLKGLEIPETLSLIFPKQLIGRMNLMNEMSSVESATPRTDILEPMFRQEGPPLSIHPPADRKIDFSLVTDLSKLTVRLESTTADYLVNYSKKDVMLQYSQMLHKYIEEAASDEEMLVLIENFVVRIENVVSSLYLKKVGRFSNVLEKLGEAIDLDASHIQRAIQVFSEVEELAKGSNIL